MNRNEVINVLNFRHACKEFDPSKKISSDDFNVILEGGRLAASSLGIEPWNFIVIENKDLLTELKPVCTGGTKQLDTCSHFVIFLSRTPNELKSNSDYINHIFKDIKHLPDEYASMMKSFIKNMEESVLKDEQAAQGYSTEQTYIALSSMLLSAAMLNIDSCTIGGFNKKAVEKILVDRGLLDTNKFDITVCAAFGYRLNDVTPKLRQSMDEVVTWVK